MVARLVFMVALAFATVASAAELHDVTVAVAYDGSLTVQGVPAVIEVRDFSDVDEEGNDIFAAQTKAPEIKCKTCVCTAESCTCTDCTITVWSDIVKGK